MFILIDNNEVDWFARNKFDKVKVLFVNIQEKLEFKFEGFDNNVITTVAHTAACFDKSNW